MTPRYHPSCQHGLLFLSETNLRTDRRFPVTPHFFNGHAPASSTTCGTINPQDSGCSSGVNFNGSFNKSTFSQRCFLSEKKSPVTLLLHSFYNMYFAILYHTDKRLTIRFYIYFIFLCFLFVRMLPGSFHPSW